MYRIFKTETLLLLLLTFIECSHTNKANRHLGLTKNEEYFANQNEHPEDMNPQISISEGSQNYCNVELSTEEFSIRSPNYPMNYSTNIDCVYTIRKFSKYVCDLWFAFTDLDLEDSDECRCDYVGIGARRYCDKAPVGVQIMWWPNEELTIRFKSDASVSGSGFRIVGRQHICPMPPELYEIYPDYPLRGNPDEDAQNCNENLSSEIISITSPNYPGNYSFNMDCTYIIRKSSPDVCGFWFSFKTLELAGDSECQQDYVEVKGKKYCGSRRRYTDMEVPFDEEEIVIRFHSDDSVSDYEYRMGFHMIGLQKTDC